MDSVLEYSRRFHQLSQPALLNGRSDDNSPEDKLESPQASILQPTSQSQAFMSTSKQSVSGHSAMELRARIQILDDEVRGCYADIETIRSRIQECLAEKQKLGTLLEKSSMNHHVTASKTSKDSKGKGKVVGNVNFSTQLFDWTDGLKARMHSVFGIQDFRLCQEGLVHVIYGRILV
jgi:ATP-dependent DNA helicase Q1